ncbi:MAG: hypothetical protein JWO56_490 [Acidobacteria bacterium]|nr:hypothetical protein [Acidobacteriota bacterium]
MKVRSLLIATALVSSILGAVAAYLVLTVPNDIAGGALLRQARDSIKGGKYPDARAKLARIVQQYPRTDAAAAATVALAEIEDTERQRLAADLAKLRRTSSLQTLQITELSGKVNQLTSAPPPAPVVAAAPEPAKTAVKKAAAKKAPVKKRRARRRR